MITVADAVREFGGKWQSRKSMLVTHDDGSYEFRDSAGHMIVCTRAEFRAEARRQGYVGFEGNTDDVAFKGHDLPAIGEECEIDSHGTGSFFLCIPKYHGVNSSVVEIWSGDTAREVWIQREHAEFRPLKSDRERWVEAALESSWNPCPSDDRKKLEYIYDAIKSGELPMPEAK